jgi:hypothetical protein
MRTDVSERDLSFTHYMFFTNNDFPLKVERGDRRLFVSEVTLAVPPKPYFDSLYEAIDNPKALRGLFDHLMAIDISNVDWIKDKPMTEYMQDLLENCAEKEMSFLSEKLRLSDEEHIEIRSKDLLYEFQDYCCRTNSEYKTTPQKFGIKLKKYKIDGFTAVAKRDGKLYTFDTKKCLTWMISQGYIEKEFFELDEAPKRLMKPEGLDEDSPCPYLPPL